MEDPALRATTTVSQLLLFAVNNLTSPVKSQHKSQSQHNSRWLPPAPNPQHTSSPNQQPPPALHPQHTSLPPCLLPHPLRAQPQTTMPPSWPFPHPTHPPPGPPYTCTHEHADRLIARVKPLPENTHERDAPRNTAPNMRPHQPPSAAVPERDQHNAAQPGAREAQEYDPFREREYVAARRVGVAGLAGLGEHRGHGKGLVDDVQGMGVLAEHTLGVAGRAVEGGSKWNGDGDVGDVFEDVCLDDEGGEGEWEREWVFVGRAGGVGKGGGVGDGDGRRKRREGVGRKEW
ncbi:hypothetical protein MMC17_004404 [Xylographa soralifera]|nr:hypothetical protein [Xylographa soralifera]